MVLWDRTQMVTGHLKPEKTGIFCLETWEGPVNYPKRTDGLSWRDDPPKPEARDPIKLEAYGWSLLVQWKKRLPSPMGWSTIKWASSRTEGHHPELQKLSVHVVAIQPPRLGTRSLGHHSFTIPWNTVCGESEWIWCTSLKGRHTYIGNNKNSHPRTLQRANGKLAVMISNHDFLSRAYFKANS